MSEAAVVDASPLIYLAHANLIDLLRVASPLILVPTTVSQEIRRRGANDPTVQALENTPWLREVEPGPDSPRVVPWPVVERLREAGMYLSDAVLSRALALVGE